MLERAWKLRMCHSQERPLSEKLSIALWLWIRTVRLEMDVSKVQRRKPMHGLHCQSHSLKAPHSDLEPPECSFFALLFFCAILNLLIFHSLEIHHIFRDHEHERADDGGLWAPLSALVSSNTSDEIASTLLTYLPMISTTLSSVVVPRWPCLPRDFL